MKWNATYTVKTDDGAELAASMQLDAADFEEAMTAAIDRKGLFKDGSEIRISSLRELDAGRHPIGFGA